MSLAMLYDYPETDEMGIKLTAREMGLDLVHIPFRKVSVSIHRDGLHFKNRRRDLGETLEGVNSILNRTQSKNSRLYSASIMEALGKYVINPVSVEYLCFSKFRTLVKLWSMGISIPRTVFVPCDSVDRTVNGRVIRNEEAIADLIQDGIGGDDIVVKPDAGTHGKDVRLARDRRSLILYLTQTRPSTINPIGIVAQEFVEKWFYDLRIIVMKERGKPPYCYPTALARGGFKDFRTNTYLGNMVFGVDLPPEIQRASVNCGKAVGTNREAWVLALDAMFNIGEDQSVDDEHVKTELEKLVPLFNVVKRVKLDKTKMRDFPAWSRRLEGAYQKYKDSESYGNVKDIIEESIERKKNEILFHEVNSCPEFWEQTRLIAGINVAVALIKCAESVEGWSTYQWFRKHEQQNELNE